MLPLLLSITANLTLLCTSPQQQFLLVVIATLTRLLSSHSATLQEKTKGAFSRALSHSDRKHLVHNY